MVNHLVRLFYEEHGSGLPLVLIHGFPFNHTIWSEVIPELAKQARVIVPDLRGFGRSEAPPGVYTMRQMAADIAELLDALKIQKTTLVGHSMGGYVSLAFAQAYPDQMLALGMVASHAAADTPEKRADRYATAAEVLLQGPEVVARSMVPKLTSDRALQENIHRMILGTQPVGLIGALKGMAERIDSLPLLAAMKFPVMIIAGGSDQLVPLERAREMVARMPKAQMVVIPEAGHMPMLETPTKVAGALVDLCHEVKKIF
ncbi:MAG: alpha/beta hydrolase [Chloroflexi bacterium]|nr:alpha/beta hydrolase [Chloroflexota bacterium]